MNTVIENIYGYKENYDYLNQVIANVSKRFNLENSILSIIFIDDEEMHKLNKTYRGVDRTTDVLTFAFEDNEKIRYNDIRVLGDIYISIPKMIEQAHEYGHSEKRELAFLVTHGLLHSLGYDHDTKEKEEIMFKLQDEILIEENIPKE